MQGLMGLVEDLGFYPRKVGVLEGYWQRRVGPKSVFWNELLGAWKRWDTRPAMDDGTRPGGAEKKEEVGRLWVHYEDKTGIICHQIRCGRGRGGGCWEGSQLFCGIREAGRTGGKWLRKPHLSSGQNPWGRAQVPIADPVNASKPPKTGRGPHPALSGPDHLHNQILNT